jgi:hypothetical protein
MTHKARDLQLTAYAARDWRARFFPRDRALHRGRHGVGADAVASGPAGGMGGELEAGIDETGVWIDSLAAREW